MGLDRYPSPASCSITTLSPVSSTTTRCWSASTWWSGVAGTASWSFRSPSGKMVFSLRKLVLLAAISFLLVCRSSSSTCSTISWSTYSYSLFFPSLVLPLRHSASSHSLASACRRADSFSVMPPVGNSIDLCGYRQPCTSCSLRYGWRSSSVHWRKCFRHGQPRQTVNRWLFVGCRSTWSNSLLGRT